MICSTAQHSTAQHSTAQHSTAHNSPDAPGMNTLFRPEVSAAHGSAWMGAIRLAQPLSTALIAAVAILIAVALLAYITLGSISKKARVTGITVPAAGQLSIAAPNAGILLASQVQEGQTVQAGQTLFILSTERQNSQGELTALVARQLASRGDSLAAEHRLRQNQAREKNQALSQRLANLAQEQSQLEQETTLAQRRQQLAQQSLAKFETLQGSGYVSAAQTQQKQEELLGLAKSRVLFSGTLSDEINYLSFERSGGPPIVLKKEHENWLITRPVKAQSDLMVIRGIVAALRFGKKEESFDSQESQEAYGFKNPHVKLTVGTSKSSRKSVLVLGNKAPLKKLYYAKWEGNPEIFLISEKLWKSFDRNLLSLRRRLVFDFDPEEVRGFRICYNGKYFDIIQKSGKWIFADSSEHTKEQVDPVEVKNFIELLRGVIAGEFYDERDWKDDRWGIRLKQNYLSIFLKNAKPQILYLGYPGRELNGTYAHMDKVFDLAMIHSRVAKRLERDAQSFYERRIWRGADSPFDKLKLRVGNAEFVFRKGEGGWTNTEGKNLEPEKSKWLQNLLSVIHELKYESVSKDKPGAVAPDENSYKIELFSPVNEKAEPVLEMVLVKGKQDVQGLASSLIPSHRENYVLSRKDSEILTDVIKNLM